MSKKKNIFIFLTILSIVSFITLIQVYPIGFIAVESAGLRDVTILYKGKSYKDIGLSLPVSNSSIFCYEKIFKISNMGYANLIYKLNINIDKNVTQGLIKVFANDDLIFVLENRQILVNKQIILKPHEEKTIKICLRGLVQEINLSFFDKNLPRQTAVSALIKPKLTDWYDKDFPERIILKLNVDEKGAGLFELKANGEIFFNGKRLLQIKPLIGKRANSFLIIYKDKRGIYLVPYQVERWIKDSTGIEKPLRLLSVNESLKESDRIVFKIFVSNSSEVQIYMGGRILTKFSSNIFEKNNYIYNDYLKIRLNNVGFVQNNIIVNISGYIVYPYQNKKIYLHEEGAWEKIFIGPVRAIYVFTTGGIVTRAPLTALLCIYSYSNITWTTIYPGLFENKRIILEWVSPIISGPWNKNDKQFFYNNYYFLLINGTTAQRLPIKISAEGNRLKIILASDFYLEGGSSDTPKIYGYYAYSISGLKLGKIKNVAIRYEKLSWGIAP